MHFNQDKHFLKVIDYSVSNEAFDLYRDENLDLLATIPQPDPSQLSKYYDSDDYISHTDGKRSVFEKVYHVVKNVALSRKINLLANLQNKKGNLLDIGAGTGDFLAAAKANGWQVTGAEPSEKARSISNQKGISLFETTMDLESHSFDAITMWHVLEHVADPQQQIAELKRLLKPNGTIIVAVPNFNAFDAKHYGQFWAAYDVPRHLWHFSRTAIGRLFEHQQMTVQQILPMKFDSFYVSLLSEKYKTGRMNYPKAFWIGLQSNLKGARSGEYSSHIYIIANKN
jgi:2-polyprenyl-3-methyl-5-hydroxy-6-metoxy-1,4-benzoquinol methylase